MTSFISHSPEETQRYAVKLGASLRSGCVIALSGELGSGKTEFTKGLAKGLGVCERIASPTYILMSVYAVCDRGDIETLVHADCYRLDGTQQLEDIGFTDYLKNSRVVVVIEWGEKAKELLPTSTRWFQFTSEGEQSRRITEASRP